MKGWKALSCLLAMLFALAGVPRARANNAGAVVLVNSQSANYVDFTHFIQPYLGNFGVPYTILDISTTALNTNLTNYALIIIGHAALDTNRTYLTTASQTNIAWAVSNGVGLVSFDNVLANNTTPLYQFEQSIFGLTYTNSSQDWTVEFPPTQPGLTMHYITSLHVTNDLITLSNAAGTGPMPISGFSLPTNDTAVVTTGGQPLVVVTKYGQGRAVQWSSYAWMSTAIQGPVNGLDDLVWRGFVWAARKPFVMRAMPHLATIRIDDVTGDYSPPSGVQPLWWVHEMTNVGFKPWLALFTDDLNYETYTYPDPFNGVNRLLDLSNMVASGSVTASMHSFSANQSSEPNFFYFDHKNLTEYSDGVMSNNYVLGTQFFQANGIPSSTVVIAHYSEAGTNAFNGLTNFGVQFFMDEMVPGTLEYESPYAPWMMAGPYRLYDTPQEGESGLPFFYADWLTVPNHPELNGKIFDCYTEIRNVSPYNEWAPSETDLPGSITRGYQMLKRGFDSMTLGNIFTHEFFIDPSDGPAYGNFTTNDFLTVLQGITNEIAPYSPIYVTMDYGCKYVRATRTSQISSADYNSVTGQVTASFSGYTDMPINAYYYTGVDNGITNNAGTVPVFTNSTNCTLGSLSTGPPTLLVTANNLSKIYGATNPALAYTISGFLGTDTVAVVSGSAGLNTTATTNSGVGTYTINITNINLSANNYVFAFADGTLNVTAASLAVVASNQSRLYGATNPALTYSITGFSNTDTLAVVSGAPTVGTAAISNTVVGTYPITINSGSLAAANYTFGFANGALMINRAPLGVTANATNRVYGTTNPVFTASYTGFVNNEKMNVLLGSPSLTATALTNSPVGPYIIIAAAGTLTATNYSFNFTNGTMMVTQAALLVTASNQTRLYGATNPALTYGITGFLGTDTVAVVSGLPGLSTVADAGSNVGTYPITITNINLSAVNYSFNFANGVLTVNRAPLGVTANNQSRLYGATNPVLTTSYSGFVNNETTSVLTGNPSLSTTATTNSPVNTYAIAIAQNNLAATNYTFNFTNGVLTVNPAPLGVTANNQSRLYGATNPVFTASYSGFVNSETTSVLAGSPLLSTTAVTNSPVGLYPITAAAGTLSDTNYTFSFTNGTLNIAQAALLVTASNQSRMYGVTNPVLTYSISGFLGTDTVAVVSGVPGLSMAADTNANVGTYPIIITNVSLSATNYAFNFANGSLTVTAAPLGVTANNQSRLYGATNPVFTASYSGFVNSDTSSVLVGSPFISTTATTNSPVNAYAITITQSGLAATNYTFNFTNGVLTVSPAPLGVTANNQSRLYGATNPVFTASYSGFVNSETASVLTGNPSLTTAAVTNSPVGLYPITAAAGTLSDTNYTFSFTNGTLNIAQAALLVTASNQTRLYGATNPVLTYGITGFLGTDTVAVVSGVPGLSTVADMGSNVGTYPIIITNVSLSATNYAFNFANGSLTVTPAPLGVTADNQSRLYGATNPVFTASYSGFVNNDTSSVLAGSPFISTTATTNSPVNAYAIAITQSGLAATNYTFNFTNGVLTVNPAPLGVTANNQNRLYGATNPVFTASYSGFVNNETASVLAGSPLLSTTAATNSPVGLYPITAAAGTLGDANYTFSFTNGTLNIGQAALLVAANNQSRLYGATNPVMTYSLSGFLGTDTVAVVSGVPGLSTVADAGSNVGTYPIIITNASLSATNYAFNFANGSLTVTPAPLGVTADNQSRLYGATNPVFTASYTGFVNNDTSSVLAGSPFISTTATTNSPVNAYAIAITQSGLAATNYTFNFTNGVLTVNPAPLGVTANNQSRLYGTTNPVFTASYSGFVNNETTSVLAGSPLLSTTAVTNSPVGLYPITAAAGTLSDTNYTFSFTNGTLNIAQAALLVTASNQSRMYGVTNPVLTYSISGFLGTDTVAVVSGVPGLSMAADTNANVGTYPIIITNVSLSATNYAFNFANGSLAVTPAPLGVTADNQSRLYGATNPVFTASYSGFVNNDTSSVLAGSPFISTTATTNSPVNAYAIAITQSGLAATNYTFNFTNGVLTVNPAPLGVTANNQNRLYGATNPVFTASYSGFVNNETASVLAGSPLLSTTAATNSPVGLYPITAAAGTLGDANYTFSFTNGTLNIGQAALLVAANNQSRLYGATNPVMTYSLSGFLGTDTVAVVSGVPGLSTVADAGSNVGTYPIIITNINLSAANYGFNFTNGTLTVLPATLLVSANNQTRPYGATNPVLTYAVSGFQGSDTGSVVSGAPTISASADGASPVGSYPIAVANGSLSASDYNFAFANGILTVTATPPVIMSITGAGTGNVVITWGALSNVTYRVRYTSDFNGSNWQNLTPDITATNNTASTVDHPGNAAQRFYQVLVP